MKTGKDLCIGDTIYYVRPDSLGISKYFISKLEGIEIKSYEYWLSDNPDHRKIAFPLIRISFINWEKTPTILYDGVGGQNRFNGFEIFMYEEDAE